MTTHSPVEIKQVVRQHYGARARAVAEAAPAPGCCGDQPTARSAYYSAEETGGLPESAVSYGCGNPTAIAGLRPGETVLDLGSGAGLDCFLAARQVGETGRVIGLDMTPEMLELARRNQASLGLDTVEFRRGEMEAMPVEEATVDVIISNCVINLSPDKDAVFHESFRVLRPGGRLHVSDVVLTRPLTSDEAGDLNRWAGCVSGALQEADYQARLEAAGFREVEVVRTEAADHPWLSALITAYRPRTDGTVRRAAPATVPLPVRNSAAAACCGSDASQSCSCC